MVGAQWCLSHRILGSCTGLMQAIHILVLASKDLQREIVESGRVSWDGGGGKGSGRDVGRAEDRDEVIVHMLLQPLFHWDFPSSCQELLSTPRGSPWLWFLGCHGDP